jgi:hypothetical protein
MVLVRICKMHSRCESTHGSVCEIGVNHQEVLHDLALTCHRVEAYLNFSILIALMKQGPLHSQIFMLILVSPVSHYHTGLTAVGRAGVAVCDRYLTRAGRASPQLPSITIHQTIGKPTR